MNRKSFAAAVIAVAVSGTVLTGCKSTSGSSSNQGPVAKATVPVTGVDPCKIYPSWTVDRLLGVTVGKSTWATNRLNYAQWSCTYSDSKGQVFRVTTYADYSTDGSPYSTLRAKAKHDGIYVNMNQPGVQVPFASFRIGHTEAVSSKDNVTVKVELLRAMDGPDGALNGAITVFSAASLPKVTMR